METWRYKVAWPFRKALELAYGIHSRIPVCCVAAFARGCPAEAYGNLGYRPCRKCASEIESGLRRPAEIESCLRKAWTCRALAYLSLLVGAIYREPCPLCGFRGMERLDAENEDGSLSEREFGHCLRCDEIILLCDA